LTSTKIYTRKGDAGKTSLVNGEKVAKSHQRLDAYGSVDELNSVIGVLLSHLSSHGFDHATVFLLSVQNHLFNLGSQLACSDATMRLKLPQITAEDVKILETEMDDMSKDLPPLTQFILPGGHLLASHTHVARTVCRRVERECVKLSETDEVAENILPYLNRLNDYFFVLARHFNHVLGHNEIVWEK
jgi:cob(I)alamin adenosyltransferase